MRFGPDPSTHPRCTVGGMIGNNACGSRSLAYGRTSDNVLGLRLLTAAGEEVVTGHDGAGRPTVTGGDTLLAGVRDVMGRHLVPARTELGRFGRQVSGYAAHHLLPERFDLTPALVGSEGTLAVVTEATVRLVVDPAVRVVVVLGFDSIVDAGRRVAGRRRARSHQLRGPGLTTGRGAPLPPRRRRRAAAAARQRVAVRRARGRGRR